MDYVEFLELSRFLTAKSWNKRECFLCLKSITHNKLILLLLLKNAITKKNVVVSSMYQDKRNSFLLNFKTSGVKHPQTSVNSPLGRETFGKKIQRLPPF